jgi:hypothetical protein
VSLLGIGGFWSPAAPYRAQNPVEPLGGATAKPPTSGASAPEALLLSVFAALESPGLATASSVVGLASAQRLNSLLPRITDNAADALGQVGSNWGFVNLGNFNLRADCNSTTSTTISSLKGHGPTVFAHACKMGLEGIASKRKHSAYRSGRSPDWLKSKDPAAPAAKREAEDDWR